MRFIAAFLLLVTAPAAFAQYGETIVITRHVLELRVTARDGTPITDLRPDEFLVDIDGTRATVESATWIDDREAQTRHEVNEEGEVVEVEAPAGRLFVLFIQTDFARETIRIVGQMKFNHYLDQVVDELQEGDRMAVFSFDSHLKFRRDFTSDKDSLRKAIRESLRIDRPPAPPAVPEPSLAKHLDRKEMRDAVDSETGLLIVGNALGEIEGMKTLLLAGWGLGQRSGAAVETRPAWDRAVIALRKSRTSIIAMNTGAGNELAFGMQIAAKETGGFYMHTGAHAQQVIERLQRTVSGHYELSVIPPDALAPGAHRLNVSVSRRGATVLTPAFVIEQP